MIIEMGIYIRMHAFIHLCPHACHYIVCVYIPMDDKMLNHIGVVTTMGLEPDAKAGGVVIEAFVVSIVVIREGEDWLGQIHYREALIP